VKKTEKKVAFIKLFAIMFKIGLFTFGGGYAMIPIIREEVVTKRHYMTEEEFLDMLAMAESTPGPIAINTATYLGYRLSGFFGSVMATLGVVLPSFSIIYVISLFFEKFQSLALVGYAFRGIRVAVVYLILTAGIKMLKGIEKKPLPLLIFGTVLVTMVAFSLFAVTFSTVYYILIAAVFAFVLYLVDRMKKEEKA